MGNYTELNCLKSLSNKKDIMIKDRDIQILRGAVMKTDLSGTEQNPIAKFDVGISSLAKIDYLVKVHSYRKMFVRKFIKST